MESPSPGDQQQGVYITALIKMNQRSSGGQITSCDGNQTEAFENDAIHAYLIIHKGNRDVLVLKQITTEFTIKAFFFVACVCVHACVCGIL